MSQRCPRCGNSPPKDSHVCTFCGKRLKTERIENFFIFQRYEEEWDAPLGFFTRLYLLIVNPSKAFWDINHKRDSSPGWIILLLNALIYGLFGLAIFSHFQIPFILFGYEMVAFLVFFMFGFVYYLILYRFLYYLFKTGANYSIGFGDRMKERFGSKAEEAEKEIAKQADVSVFSIYKSGVLLQKQAAHKFKMLLCAFTPFLITGLIKVLIVLVVLPTSPIGIPQSGIPEAFFDTVFQSQSWMILDIIDSIVLIGWIPITMTIGIRELANSSTFRVYISSLIIGTISSIILFLLKPAFFGLAY